MSWRYSTWFSDTKRSTAIRHYAIRRVSDGEILVRSRSLYVWVDIKTGRPIRIPERFLADFADNQAPSTSPKPKYGLGEAWMSEV